VPALGVTDSAIVAFEGWLRTVALQKLTTGHDNGDKRQRTVSFSTRWGFSPGGRTHLSR